MAVVVTAFLIYHLWLIKLGRTTNEHYKWDNLFGREKLGRAVVIPSAPSNLQVPQPQHSSKGIIDSQSPNNVYNQGFLLNLHEIFSPRSLRIYATRRAKAASNETQDGR